MKQVFFDSFTGRYSDNPRAIYEEIVRRNIPVQEVWTRSNAAVFPDSVHTVSADTDVRLDTIANSDVLIANRWLPPGWSRKPGTPYVQTWHGTPLKRLLFDNPHYDTHPEALAEWATEVAKIDIMVSPNRFSTEVLTNAFRYTGEVIETGYPRNDLLRTASPEYVANLKAQLGIDPTKKLVLYAPTWRDIAFEEDATIHLNLDSARQHLGDDHVLLLRTHYLVSSHAAQIDNSFVLDMSEYEDIRDLYLLADVLVTDYSSSMFDFAITGKPILYFTYDLERYRDEVRGFYFDFENESPGPLLRASEEVVESLRNIASVNDEFASRYDAFRKRFCHLDDGHAAERVVDRLLPLLT